MGKDIYKSVDELVGDLKKQGYNDFAALLKQAKLAGSSSSEILYEIETVLKTNKDTVNAIDLTKQIEKLLGDINDSFEVVGDRRD